eukprot:SAG31_NODE_432_length_15773_cov_7.563892_6_plen_154_part_00
MATAAMRCCARARAGGCGAAAGGGGGGLGPARTCRTSSGSSCAKTVRPPAPPKPPLALAAMLYSDCALPISGGGWQLGRRPAANRAGRRAVAAAAPPPPPPPPPWTRGAEPGSVQAPVSGYSALGYSNSTQYRYSSTCTVPVIPARGGHGGGG